jgi:hypothetical protein
MIRISNVQYLDITAPTEKFRSDVFFAAATLESRCVHIPRLLETYCSTKISLLESRSDKRQARINARILKSMSFSEERYDGDLSAEKIVHDRLRTAAAIIPVDKVLSVLVDVSCFSRKTMAVVIAEVIQLSRERTVQLTLAYSLASYVPPANVGMAANREVSPVHSAFSGWTTSPGLSVASVVGLGYERDKAMGAVEYLQSSDWWIFEPESPEVQYRPQVEEHNKRIIAATPPGRRLIYDVLSPVDTLIGLESLVAGLKKNYKPVLLPFGPKLFFALSLLVSALHEDVAVWSVSGEESEPEVDRKPSMFVTAISVVIN